MDLDEEAHTPEKTIKVHAHRLDHTSSKLPAFRFADLQRSSSLPVSALLSPASDCDFTPDTSPYATNPGALLRSPFPGQERASDIATRAVDSGTSSSSTKATTTPTSGSKAPLADPYSSCPSNSPSQRQQSRGGRKPPASHSSNGIGTFARPPPDLSTQRSVPPESAVRPQNQSTTEWALAQQQLALKKVQSSPATAEPQSTINTKPEEQLQPGTPTSAARIPPIRSFRSSATRTSLGMESRSYYRYGSPEEDDDDDRDRTLRALVSYSNEGYTDRRNTYSADQEHIESPDNGRTSGDLFLDLALDDLSRRESNEDRDKARTTAQERRRSRIALPSNRSSLPPPSNSYPTPMPRRGSDLQTVSTSYSRANESSAQGQQTQFQKYTAYTHGRATSIPTSPLDLNKSRYPPLATRSTPSTPKVFNSRESTYDAQPLSSGRRPSIPDSTTGSQVRGQAYRQSNLSSFSTPRMYNSSPIVARTAEPVNVAELPNAAESTDDGTTSTTAPSTVWDELDDLKSRIRKLELTGKLPATSGAAVSHASGERPPTATTTATTMSTSPKRNRGASMSLIDANGDATYSGEAHPLLHAALAKSKSVLNPDIYKALESAASDALAVASMVGSDGRQGPPISSAQSVIGTGTGSIADRQLRRKADSMCRSLTELCIALSDITQSQSGPSAAVRPMSRGKELQIQVENSEPSPRQLIAPGDTLTRAKQSPSRALSRLEARRSSLFATSALPSPRFDPNQLATPTQSSIAGRRTSMMVSRRRAGTEEREEEDDARFRAPSRATTEIGRVRNSPREYTSQQPVPERAPTVISNLPVRRQFSANLSPSSTIQNLASQRRYLDRSTPERDTSSVVGRLAEERGQRQAVSVMKNLDAVGLNRTRSLAGPNGRLRARSNVASTSSNMDSSTAVQVSGFR